MDADRDDPQRRTDEHHHRGLSGSREFREIFGVPGMVKTGAVEAVLVDRVGHERRGAPRCGRPGRRFQSNGGPLARRRVPGGPVEHELPYRLGVTGMASLKTATA